MASSNSNRNSSKKRHSFFSQFLSTKNLSIFRHKSSTNDTFKDSKQYQSEIDITSDQTQVPICISRGWVKKHSQRPISLDLELVKDLLISNHNNEHFIEQTSPISYKKHFGTNKD